MSTAPVAHVRALDPATDDELRQYLDQWAGLIADLRAQNDDLGLVLDETDEDGVENLCETDVRIACVAFLRRDRDAFVREATTFVARMAEGGRVVPVRALRATQALSLDVLLGLGLDLSPAAVRIRPQEDSPDRLEHPLLSALSRGGDAETTRGAHDLGRRCEAKSCAMDPSRRGAALAAAALSVVAGDGRGLEAAARKVAQLTEAAGRKELARWSAHRPTLVAPDDLVDLGLVAALAIADARGLPVARHPSVDASWLTREEGTR